MNARYDTIGRGYADLRRPDPRIAALLGTRLDGATTVVNVGAGVGSYEPDDVRVVAVEPSRVMIDQRPQGIAPAVQACAEALPFADGSFDAALAVLTMHHWSSIADGLREVRRVARRLVLLTWECYPKDFWLLDYLPQIETIDDDIFPPMEQLADWLGDLDVAPLPVPHDCSDGFMCAYWRRPHSYLDANVRSAISTFAQHDADFVPGLQRLAADLQSGAWERRYGHILEWPSYDLGYRIVTTRS
ncbi:MAG: class I SAM-dependent methyltransferase [Planctomycetota bacterium]